MRQNLIRTCPLIRRRLSSDCTIPNATAKNSALQESKRLGVNGVQGVAGSNPAVPIEVRSPWVRLINSRTHSFGGDDLGSLSAAGCTGSGMEIIPGDRPPVGGGARVSGGEESISLRVKRGQRVRRRRCHFHER